MTNKITQKEMFNEIIALAESASREDIVEFAKGRIEMLARKNANKKATANQQANEVLKTEILNVLGDKRMTASEILTQLVADGTVPSNTMNQKISAVLRLMKEVDGTVDKVTDKKRSLFFAVGATE